MWVGKEFIYPHHGAQGIGKGSGVVVVGDLHPLDYSLIHCCKPPGFPETYIRLKAGVRDEDEPEKQAESKKR